MEVSFVIIIIVVIQAIHNTVTVVTMVEDLPDINFIITAFCNFKNIFKFLFFFW